MVVKGGEAYACTSAPLVAVSAFSQVSNAWSDWRKADQMTTSFSTGSEGPRDAPYWTHTSPLHISQVPAGALNLNVDGRQVVGPLQGFGPLWQRTYRLTLPEAA